MAECDQPVFSVTNYIGSMVTIHYAVENLVYVSVMTFNSPSLR